MPFRGECVAVCINPKFVLQVWPLASGFIKRALDTNSISSFEGVTQDVFAGRALLWLAVDSEIRAAAITQLTNGACEIVACGGVGMHRWLSLIERIEDYAREEDCRCVRILGRKGWARVLKNYAAPHVLLERQL